MNGNNFNFMFKPPDKYMVYVIFGIGIFDICITIYYIFIGKVWTPRSEVWVFRENSQKTFWLKIINYFLCGITLVFYSLYWMTIGWHK